MFWRGQGGGEGPGPLSLHSASWVTAQEALAWHAHMHFACQEPVAWPGKHQGTHTRPTPAATAAAASFFCCCCSCILLLMVHPPHPPLPPNNIRSWVSQVMRRSLQSPSRQSGGSWCWRCTQIRWLCVCVCGCDALYGCSSSQKEAATTARDAGGCVIHLFFRG